jgi:phage tail tape-measure protein
MKSTFLKAVKVVSLSLALSLGASGVVFANGAGASPTKVALNGAGNGAGGSTTVSKRKTKRRVAKRTVKRSKTAKTAQHSTH